MNNSSQLLVGDFRGGEKICMYTIKGYGKLIRMTIKFGYHFFAHIRNQWGHFIKNSFPIESSLNWATLSTFHTPFDHWVITQYIIMCVRISIKGQENWEFWISDISWLIRVPTIIINIINTVFSYEEWMREQVSHSLIFLLLLLVSSESIFCSSFAGNGYQMNE